MDPYDPTIYLGSRQGTVYRSDRAGEEGSWEPIAELGSRVRTIEVAPGSAEERTLYAGTLEGVRRSDDGGATWEATGPDTVALLCDPGEEAYRACIDFEDSAISLGYPELA